jgi:F-type H+-transporting ATPase subunit b
LQEVLAEFRRFPKVKLNSSLWLVRYALVVFLKARHKIVGIVDAKIDKIKKDIETAEMLRIEAQELLAQYERKQRDADKEAEEIIKNAEEHAKKIHEKAKKDLKLMSDRREAQLEQRIKRMEEEAIQEIKTYAADLALQAAQDILSNEVSKKDNSDLIDATLKTINTQIN